MNLLLLAEKFLESTTAPISKILFSTPLAFSAVYLVVWFGAAVLGSWRRRRWARPAVAASFFHLLWLPMICMVSWFHPSWVWRCFPSSYPALWPWKMRCQGHRYSWRCRTDESGGSVESHNESIRTTRELNKLLFKTYLKPRRGKTKLRLVQTTMATRRRTEIRCSYCF